MPEEGARYLAKLGIAERCLCNTKYQGGGLVPFREVLTPMTKFPAIHDFAAVVSQHRTMWGTKIATLEIACKVGSSFTNSLAYAHAVFAKFCMVKSWMLRIDWEEMAASTGMWTTTSLWEVLEAVSALMGLEEIIITVPYNCQLSLFPFLLFSLFVCFPSCVPPCFVRV